MSELVAVVLVSMIGATAVTIGVIAYGRRSRRLVPVRYVAATYGLFVAIALVIALVPEALLGGLLAAIVAIDAMMWFATRRRATLQALNSVERPEFWLIAGIATIVLAAAAMLVSSR